MYCFHAYSIFDFVLDVLIVVFTLRVYFIEIDVKLITIYYLLFIYYLLLLFITINQLLFFNWIITYIFFINNIAVYKAFLRLVI